MFKFLNVKFSSKMFEKQSIFKLLPVKIRIGEISENSNKLQSFPYQMHFYAEIRQKTGKFPTVPKCTTELTMFAGERFWSEESNLSRSTDELGNTWWSELLPCEVIFTNQGVNNTSRLALSTGANHFLKNDLHV